MSNEAREKIKAIQRLLGVTDDGIFGPKSRAAFDALIHPESWHVVKATSFADPEDVRRFRKCKAQGRSDQECFKVGDNGVGCFGDDLTIPEPYCALPPEDMEEKWGSISLSRAQLVVVRIGSVEVACKLMDRMPHRANIKNGAGIDLNLEACLRLGVQPPLFVEAAWRWV